MQFIGKSRTAYFIRFDAHDYFVLSAIKGIRHLKNREQVLPWNSSVFFSYMVPSLGQSRSRAFEYID